MAATCRFCELLPASVDAHIMPRSFLRDRSEPGRHNYLLSTKHDFAQRSPTGVYDGNLVCETCEGRFGIYDDYGHEFFKLKEAVRLVSPQNAEPLVWQCPVDYAKLKLFILSIMWRASASERSECAGVKLGQFSNRIREMIASGDPGPPDLFPILMHRYEQGADLAPLSMPRRARLQHSGVNYYKMEMAGCAVWIAIDERPIPPILKEMVLAPGRAALLFPINYKTTADWSRMARILLKIRERTGRFPVV
jgi:hypothetical protein